MTVLHCTRKLTRRMPFETTEQEPLPTNRLGPWCANTFNYGRIPLIIVTNERTLLSTLVAFKQIDSFWQRVLGSLEVVLRSAATPSSTVHEELSLMKEVRFTQSTNQKVLGSMNHLIFLAKTYLDARRYKSLEEVAAGLNSTPCSPLMYEYPQEAALKSLMRL